MTSFICTWSVNAPHILYWLGFVTVLSWVAVSIRKRYKRLLLVYVRVWLPQLYMVSVIIQVKKKFSELKGGNIRIVEKAQETRFGMSLKYSRYIRIAS